MASIANVILGASLVLSALVFHHFPVGLHSVVVGFLTLAVGLLALRGKPSSHYVGVALGVWLLTSLRVLPGRSPGQFAFDLLWGIMIFSFSCAGMLAYDDDKVEVTSAVAEAEI